MSIREICCDKCYREVVWSEGRGRRGEDNGEGEGDGEYVIGFIDCMREIGRGRVN